MAPQGKAKVLIVGSGGVGTMAAYALETGGKAEVTCVLRSNYDAVRKNGFSIDSLEHGKGIKGFRPTLIVNKVPEKESVPLDYILVSTKNVPEIKPTVLDIIEPAVTAKTTTIVLLQNGLNIEKPIIQRFPDNVVLSGVSYIGAEESTHGYILHNDNDAAKIGPFPGLHVSSELAETRARDFVDIYNACGKVNFSYDDNVLFTRWRKLVYNSSFNSIAALLRMGTTRMRMSRHVIDDLVRPAMQEIVATAKAAGVELPEGVVEQMIRVDPTDGDLMPSMGQDSAKGNYMELEYIVGEPVREAQRLGVPAPTLTTIYGLLKGLQRKTMEAKGLWKPHFEEGNPYA